MIGAVGGEVERKLLLFWRSLWRSLLWDGGTGEEGLGGRDALRWRLMNL